jgi:two-component system response regulator MtrA
MQLVLQAEGFDVVAVADGLEGVKAAEQLAPDLAIVDMYMPQMNGMETIKAIRERSPLLPMIAVSGMLPPTDARPAQDGLSAAQECGAAQVLYKPFRPHELVQAVNQSLGQLRDCA